MSDPAEPTFATVWDFCETPIGRLTLELGPRGVRAIHFPRRGFALEPHRRDRDALEPVRAHLDSYFDGRREDFDLELDLSGRGDELSQAVWGELRKIPYGETISYGEIGKAVRHSDPRDIGTCVGSTPIPIVIPCHRVIGADGALRGYGGGLPRKQHLLRLEHETSGKPGLPAWVQVEQLTLA